MDEEAAEGYTQKREARHRLRPFPLPERSLRVRLPCDLPAGIARFMPAGDVRKMSKGTRCEPRPLDRRHMSKHLVGPVEIVVSR